MGRDGWSTGLAFAKLSRISMKVDSSTAEDSSYHPFIKENMKLQVEKRKEGKKYNSTNKVKIKY